MYTLKVKKIEKGVVLADNSKVINVEIEIFNKDKKKVAEKKFSYLYSIPEKEIKKDLKKVLENYKLELEQSKAQEKTDKEEKKADKVVSSLQDFKI